MTRLVLKWLDSPWAFELNHGLNRLGRNPTNDAKISDPSVSSFHAEIEAEIAGENEVIKVRDLGSTNGTFIDDQRIDEAILKPENILRLGNIRLQLDEVLVTPREAFVAPVQNVSPVAAAALPQMCAYHPELQAIFKCENCASGFCVNCIKVVGVDRTQTTTVCPMCNGQCYELLQHPVREKNPSILMRLTQTLKIPFSR